MCTRAPSEDGSVPVYHDPRASSLLLIDQAMRHDDLLRLLRSRWAMWRAFEPGQLGWRLRRRIEGRLWHLLPDRADPVADGPPPVASAGAVRAWREDVRMYEPDELDRLLGARGLAVLRRAGDFAGGAFERDAPRQIVIARRASD